MRQTITRIILALSILFGAGTINTAKAQIPVTDAANLSQNLIFSIQQAFDAATQIGHLFEQIGIAKDTYQTFKAMYQTISPWIQKTQQVTSLLRRTAYAYNHMTYYSDYINRLAREGHISPRKIASLASYTSFLIEEVQSIGKDTKEIFKGNNSLTTSERLMQAQMQDRELQSIIDSAQLEILESVNELAKETFSDNTASGLSVLI